MHRLRRRCYDSGMTILETHDTVPTTYVEADRIRFAYRRFGRTQQHISNAKLVLYPDSNHGAHYQFHGDFVAQVKLFLDVPTGQGEQ